MPVKATKRSSLSVDGVTVNVTQKRMKNLRMRVCPNSGDIHVSAPHYALKRDIQSFAQAHIQWAKSLKDKALEKTAARQPFKTGDAINFFGSTVTLQISHASKRATYTFHENTVGHSVLCLKLEDLDDLDGQDRLITRWQKEMMAQEVLKMLIEYQPIMGVETTRFGVRKMRTRWGSCNVQARRVWFNLDLINKPKHCLEYVIVHELAHLLETNHTPRFWSIVEKFLPTWKTSHDYLNERI